MCVTAYGSLLVDRLMLRAMAAGCLAMTHYVHAGGGAGKQHYHAKDSSEIAQGLLHWHRLIFSINPVMTYRWRVH